MQGGWLVFPPEEGDDVEDVKTTVRQFVRLGKPADAGEHVARHRDGGAETGTGEPQRKPADHVRNEIQRGRHGGEP